MKIMIKKPFRKGSFTVETSIIVPIFLVMMAVAMNLGLYLYSETKAADEPARMEDFWLVDDFYLEQLGKEVVGK